MDKLTKKGLDSTQLKTIALVLMVLDHIHYFFEFTGCIPTVFNMLGRLSAPLFLFCPQSSNPWFPVTFFKYSSGLPFRISSAYARGSL